MVGKKAKHARKAKGQPLKPLGKVQSKRQAKKAQAKHIPASHQRAQPQPARPQQDQKQKQGQPKPEPHSPPKPQEPQSQPKPLEPKQHKKHPKPEKPKQEQKQQKPEQKPEQKPQQKKRHKKKSPKPPAEQGQGAKPVQAAKRKAGDGAKEADELPTTPLKKQKVAAGATPTTPSSAGTPKSVRWSPKLVVKTKAWSAKDYDRTLHMRVCDSCEAAMFGTCFTCTRCDDYDLCASCYKMRKRIHFRGHAFKSVPVVDDNNNE